MWRAGRRPVQLAKSLPDPLTDTAPPHRRHCNERLPCRRDGRSEEIRPDIETLNSSIAS